MIRTWTMALGPALALSLASCGGGVESETADANSVSNQMPEGQQAPADPEDEVELADDGTMVREGPGDDNATYTSLADCERVQSYDEGGGYEDKCEAPGDWSVTYTQSDLRENIVLVDGEGEEYAIDASTLIANGAFNELGDTVEWRSAEAGGEPRALIFRMNVARPDPMEADRSVLGIVRLDGPVCLVGTVPPGPGQNVAARKLADRRNFPDCLGNAEQGS